MLINFRIVVYNIFSQCKRKNKTLDILINSIHIEYIHIKYNHHRARWKSKEYLIFIKISLCSKFDRAEIKHFTFDTNVPVREIKTHVRRSHLAVLEASIRPIRNPIARKAYRVHIFRCLGKGERGEEAREREREKEGKKGAEAKGERFSCYDIQLQLEKNDPSRSFSLS